MDHVSREMISILYSPQGSRLAFNRHRDLAQIILLYLVRLFF